MDDGWLTLECERALYVDRGSDLILCDRLPSPVTMVLKLSEKAAARLRAECAKVEE